MKNVAIYCWLLFIGACDLLLSMNDGASKNTSVIIKDFVVEDSIVRMQPQNENYMQAIQIDLVPEFKLAKRSNIYCCKRLNCCHTTKNNKNNQYCNQSDRECCIDCCDITTQAIDLTVQIVRLCGQIISSCGDCDDCDD